MTYNAISTSADAVAQGWTLLPDSTNALFVGTRWERRILDQLIEAAAPDAATALTYLDRYQFERNI